VCAPTVSFIFVVLFVLFAHFQLCLHSHNEYLTTCQLASWLINVKSISGTTPCRRRQLLVLDWLHKPRPNRWLVASHMHFVHSQYEFRCSFGCVLLSNQIYFTTMYRSTIPRPIYLISLLWKLGLGLALDLKLHYFSIFHGE